MFASPEQMDAFVNLFRQGTRLSYDKGEYIIRPGETPAHVFYIEKGLVKAFNISKYGEENLLIIRKEHEIFPLIWAVTGQEREIIYQTLGSTIVWRITRDDYLKFLHEHPDALPPLVDMTIEMYRIHSERILNLEYRSVRERLISFLLTMSKRFGVTQENGSILLDVPLRQQDIASSINASRETTSREMSYLERQGHINASRLCITLNDKAALKKFL